MTNETLLILIDRCRIDEGKELVPGVAYLFDRVFLEPYADSRKHRARHEIIILLYQGKKVGAILRYGHYDIQWTVKEKYQGKHILSDFLRLNILKKIWPENTETELADVWNPQDYQKKRHLAELAGLCIKNLDLLESRFGENRRHTWYE